MTVGDKDHTEPYDFLIYPVGAMDFKVKNGATGLIAFETANSSIDAITAFEYCRDQMLDLSKTTMIKNGGYYPFSRALLLTHVAGGTPYNQQWGSLYPWGFPQIRPLTNTPAITMKNTNCTLNNLYFTHNQAAYSQDIIELQDGCGEVLIAGCRSYDFENKKGHCVGLHIIDGTTQQYKILIMNNQFYGFESNIHVRQDAGSASHGWMNSISVQHNRLWGSKYILKAEGGPSAGNNVMSEWHWHDNDWQPLGTNVPAANEAAIMFEGFGNTIGINGQHFSQTVAWDLAGYNFANIKAADQMDTFGCRNDNKIGGAGAVDTNAQLQRNSSYTVNEAVATFSGNGATQQFIINHSLGATPKTVTAFAQSLDAFSGGAIHVIAKSSTNFTIRFTRPPRIGTNNLLVGYRARL